MRWATSGSGNLALALLSIQRRRSAGAGIEYAFNDAISAKVEYLYVNLGWLGCPAGTLCSIDNPTLVDGSTSFTEHLIRAGVNYKFTW